MASCPKCTKEVDTKTSFCPHCGAALAAPPVAGAGAAAPNVLPTAGATKPQPSAVTGWLRAHRIIAAGMVVLTVGATGAAALLVRKASCGWCPCGTQVKQGSERSPVNGFGPNALPAQWCERLLDDGRVLRDGPYVQRARAGSFMDGQTVITGQYKLGYTVGTWQGPGGESYSGRPLDFEPPAQEPPSGWGNFQ